MLWTGRVVGPEDALYRDGAAAAGLDLSLVLAIVEVESSFRAAAWNPEPGWRYYWDVVAWAPWRKPTQAELASEFPPSDFHAPPGVAADAEWWGQATSWGLMQVMGGVARELGCTARFLSELTADPELALLYGCRQLARMVKRHGDTDDAIAAYNAGSPRVLEDAAGRKTYENQEYVDKVKAARDRRRVQIAGG